MEENSERIRDLIIETANVQIATINASIEFWKSWIDSASELSNKLSREVEEVAKSSSDSDKVIGNITDHSRAFIRQISTLPSVFSAQFEKELSRSSKAAEKVKTEKPVRRAKAKD